MSTVFDPRPHILRPNPNRCTFPPIRENTVQFSEETRQHVFALLAEMNTPIPDVLLRLMFGDETDFLKLASVRYRAGVRLCMCSLRIKGVHRTLDATKLNNQGYYLQITADTGERLTYFMIFKRV